MKKHKLIPLALLAYLIVMSFIGYDNYIEGRYSAMHYFGTIGGTLLVNVILFISLRKREQLRREREEDINRNKQ